MAFDFPASPSDGTVFTPPGGPSYVYTSGVWKIAGSGQIAIVSDTAPVNPAQGQLWWDSSQAKFLIYYNDGSSSQWVEAVTSFNHGVPEAPDDGYDYVRGAGEWWTLYREYGDWTPDLRFGGNAVGMGYSRQYGRYHRINWQVTAWFDIQLSAKGTSTGSAMINGLPFTAENLNVYYAGTVSYAQTMVTPAGHPSCHVNPGSSQLQITVINSAATPTALGSATDTAFNATSRVIGSVTYEIG